MSSVRALFSLTGLLVVLAPVLSGCAGPGTGVGYYWQSVSGHLRIMQAARPLQDWLDDAQTPPALRQRLALAQRMRRFAAAELALPDNASYHRYADLHRKAAVYNVVAAPALSLTLQSWCFPVVGCVGYRGYFDETQAQAFARSLPEELESVVYPVPAYSTLGWMNWAGGDPLLNTFIGYPEGELARIVFHELAHQVLYAKGDMVFNESFATAVERLGGERWLAQHASDAARRDYAVFDARRHEFRALTYVVRQRLEGIFADTAIDDAEKTRRKSEAMADFHQTYQTLRQRWNGYAGYDAWVARANNASFGAQAAYDTLVPGFEALFEREGRDFRRFYDAVRALAQQPQEERHAALRRLSTPSEATVAAGQPAPTPTAHP
ncbi:MAG: aminopeptidase [Burkholderiales bacterium RIFCSPLOWO2_12_67_14]|nr:MAG: aminopeptidase [Burkholderiales bacterium RIFCSPLOWO2_02_FULL_67_64]OGB44103.1 MAG: aminopeptidase [Burkholderiales bacterium RIFCSPHIGHO2_12_FULL_67_38]OGB48613.1 MAG: aminopeptidase [Burkholderiales bacterium RIFCSPLOWO2_12_67_14]